LWVLAPTAADRATRSWRPLRTPADAGRNGPRGPPPPVHGAAGEGRGLAARGLAGARATRAVHAEKDQAEPERGRDRARRAAAAALRRRSLGWVGLTVAHTGRISIRSAGRRGSDRGALLAREAWTTDGLGGAPLGVVQLAALSLVARPGHLPLPHWSVWALVDLLEAARVALGLAATGLHLGVLLAGLGSAGGEDEEDGGENS